PFGGGFAGEIPRAVPVVRQPLAPSTSAKWDYAHRARGPMRQRTYADPPVIRRVATSQQPGATKKASGEGRAAAPFSLERCLAALDEIVSTSHLWKGSTLACARIERNQFFTKISRYLNTVQP